nr:metalloregulator ArsR/SmtB family transcription factor [Kineosporia babensis]
MTVFEILALPARREILSLLRQGPRSVGELVEELGISQPIVSKQLRVLREAGFVSVRAEAQRRWYELRPEPFTEVANWLEPYRWIWSEHLDRLGDQLDALAAAPPEEDR